MPFVLILRSLIFNALFYLNLAMLMLAALPAFVLPRWAVVGLAKQWGRNSIWLLRVICGIKVEYRGLEKIPPGPLLIAAKHQSTWETFALLHLFSDPTFIIKRELMWIPMFGWCTWKAGMIPVDRGAGKAALADMARARARALCSTGARSSSFRKARAGAAGAEPNYKFGIAHLYAEGVAPCLPIALNSGLFWPRRKLLRYPGTIVVEILDPIPPGLDRNEFFQRLQDDIEAATARLIGEGRRELAAQDVVIDAAARRSRTDRSASPIRRAASRVRAAEACGRAVPSAARPGDAARRRGSPAPRSRAPSPARSRGSARNARAPGARDGPGWSRSSRPAYCGWLRSTM